MAKELHFNEKIVFQCSVCNLKYKEKETAIACENFCAKHPNQCDPAIVEKAIE